MNYYLENYKCLQDNKKYFYRKLEKFNDTRLTSNINVTSMQCKNGEKTIQLTIHDKNYRLNSLYNPSEEAVKWTNQFSFHNLHTVIELFGLGNGIVAREIMKRMKDEDRLLIYEPSVDIFLHVFHEYDLTDLLKNKNVSIAVEGINEFEFHNMLMAIINKNNLQNQIFCAHPQYNKIFMYQYKDFLKELKDNNLQAVVSANTGVVLGEKMIKYSLHNIKYLSSGNSVPDFIGEFPSDIPAIIVAAGPSIKKNVNDLKKAKGKAVIFAVDRILEYLLENGVEPDFVLTLAPVKTTDMFFTKGKVHIPIITTMEGNPEILDVVDNKKIICDCNDFIAELYTKLGKIPPKVITGVSVATMAFSVCRVLNFTKIVLVGQDLAYDEFGNSHGSVIKEEFREEDIIMLDGINGGKVKSRYDWYRMLIWYQDMLECFPEVTLIDATEGGAKISGSIVMKLSEVIEEYCLKDIDCGKIVANKKRSFDQNKLKEFLLLLEDNINELEIINQKVIDGIQICDELVQVSFEKRKETDLDYNKVNKLSEINNYIETRTVNKLIDLYVTAHTTEQLLDIYKLTGNEEEDKQKTYKKVKLIYESTREAINFIKPYMQDAINIVQSDIECLVSE